MTRMFCYIMLIYMNTYTRKQDKYQDLRQTNLSLTDIQVRHWKIPTSVLQRPFLPSVAEFTPSRCRNAITANFCCNLKNTLYVLKKKHNEYKEICFTRYLKEALAKAEW